ncbi:hypothetical protein C8F04DRAFT_1316571 [Mycena alexandri]|uniref:Uncharacterized protein n=1 Tax=Mycena alexandri TaxID=1745969 RepID=A0AAD6S4N9_9AGAR|nr:hypothetical protein C8F04DRAFT_1316571 [Mycena alexandri]
MSSRNGTNCHPRCVYPPHPFPSLTHPLPVVARRVRYAGTSAPCRGEAHQSKRCVPPSIYFAWYPVPDPRRLPHRRALVPRGTALAYTAALAHRRVEASRPHAMCQVPSPRAARPISRRDVFISPRRGQFSRRLGFALGACASGHDADAEYAAVSPRALVWCRCTPPSLRLPFPFAVPSARSDADVMPVCVCAVCIESTRVRSAARGFWDVRGTGPSLGGFVPARPCPVSHPIPSHSLLSTSSPLLLTPFFAFPLLPRLRLRTPTRRCTCATLNTNHVLNNLRDSR